MDEDSESEETRIVLMVLGNSSVGKTSYILRYAEDSFQGRYLSTVGIDFKTKDITIKGQTYTIFLYDTSGQERYKSLSLNMLKNAEGFIMMYDITYKDSFDSINYWIESVKETKGKDCPMILLGNKIDMEHERKVTTQEGENTAKKNNIEFFETSNKGNININESIKCLIDKILEKREKEKENNIPSRSYSKLSVRSLKKRKKKSCC